MTPVPEARTAHLRRALEETRQLLGEHLDHTIGELQNALTHASARGLDLRDALADLGVATRVADEPAGIVTARVVMVVAVEFFGVTVAELRGGRGPNCLARARQVAMYLCRELAGLSLPVIGREFDRDHTTVLHAARKIRDEIATGGRTASQVRHLTELIRHRAATERVRAPMPGPAQANERGYSPVEPQRGGRRSRRAAGPGYHRARLRGFGA